ncbi:MAG: hypothetical protein IPJ74_05530 [Saprospiraceae bacterium]|nr:hypothetical protein [Saprospiraceae bacterium]
MKVILCSFFAIAVSICCFGQQPPPIDVEQNLRALGNLTPLSAGAIGFDNRYEGIKGTPFLFEDWVTGNIQFVKQDTFSTSVKLNVDLITQTITVQLRDGSLGEITAAYVQAIKISDPIFPRKMRNYIVVREGDIEGLKSVRPKFYEALYKGEFMFLKSIQKKFRKADYAGAYSADRRYDEFLTEEVYWLKSPKSAYEKVTPKRKDILKTLSAYEGEIEKIIKEKKLGLNNEEDISKMLEFLEASQR